LLIWSILIVSLYVSCLCIFPTFATHLLLCILILPWAFLSFITSSYISIIILFHIISIILLLISLMNKISIKSLISFISLIYFTFFVLFTGLIYFICLIFLISLICSLTKWLFL
jgi:hypothetical protein